MSIFIALMVLFVLIALACVAYNGKDDGSEWDHEAFKGRWE